MKVVIPGGEVFDLGTTATTPTVGIIDYSRRVTDDFGVTTVVERGFARRMSVRIGVPIELVDAVQRKLAALRATAAQWVANDAYACLSVNGFFKDFDLDVATKPLSYCTLTVEGLAETEPFVDTGVEPAPFGQASTLRLLQPATITDATLVSSNLTETDYPQWAAGTTYALSARVLRGSAHRIYESAAAGNVGNDPAAATGKWSDIGPTNRFAMFDQALGSTSDNATAIAVTLDAPTINAVALLDVTGTSVRVQATGYDKTQPVGAGAITFLDLPAGVTRATVTLTGSGTVSVGTLLVGKLVGLGVTEASPTAGITDYSRKDVDDFGAVTIVERAWAKRMTANALISTAAIDSVFSRLATVRATPSLWIGQAGYDSLTIYGFFKEFSIEVGDTVSKLSLSIEGLSTAGKIEPFAPGGGSVDWPNVGDPDGTKPANNADVTGQNTSKDTNAVGGKPSAEFLAELAAARSQLAYIDGTTIPTINTAVANANTRIDAAKSEATQAVAAANVEIGRANDKISDARSAAASALAQAVALLDAKDVQLNTRIDSVSASGGYNDTAVYAEVSRVDQTAISRDGVIGQRIDSVVTSYQNADTTTNSRIDTVSTTATNAKDAVASLSTTVNTRFSGVSDTLSSYDQRILSLSTNVTSYVGRTTLLESRAGNTSNYASANASFTAWPDGAATPSQWSVWFAGTFGRENSPYQPGAYMVRHVADDLNNSGLTTSFYLTQGYWVIEASVWCSSGNFQGAGVYVDHLPLLNFSTAPDTAGGVGVANPGIRSWSVLVMSQYDGQVDLRAMTNSSLFAPTTATAVKTLRWLKCGVRPATDGEVKAQKADIALPLLTARVTTAESTLVDLPNQYATASRASTLEAQINGTASSNLLARANSQATVIADAKVGVVSQRIDGVVTAYQSADTAANGRIDQVQLTASNAGQSVASLSTSVDTRFTGVNTTLTSYDQRITSLSTNVTSYVGRTTLLESRAGNTSNYASANASFSAWPDGAATPSQWNVWFAGSFTRENSPYQPGAYMVGHAAPSGSNSGLTTSFYLTQGYWVIEASVWCSSGSFQGAGAYVDNLTPVNFATAPDTSGDVGAKGPGIRSWSVLVMSQFDGQVDLRAMTNWTTFGATPAKTLHWLKCGARPATDGEVKALKADVALPLLTARVTTAESTLVDLPNRYATASRADTIEAQLNGTANSNLLARANTQATVVADAKAGAVAQTVATLRSEYNGTAATVTQQAGTLAGINGRTSVYWSVTGTTADGSTTVQLSKADGTPGLFYIGANLLVDGNAIFNGTVTIRALDRSTMTATTSGSVSGSYGGAGQAAFAHIPNLGADMAIKSGGSIYLTFTGNIAATTDSSGTIYASIEILNAADNSVLASVRLPTPGFGPSGRLDNFVIRILNVWGDITLRWRVANRTTGTTWSIVQNPQCSVYWTAL